MLRFLRTKATSFFIKALFGMIIVVFVFWGIGTFRVSEKVVAEVGKYRIYYPEYYEEVKRVIELERSILKHKFDEEASKDLKIKEKAIENLIDRYLLLILSEKMGIDVSETEYMEHLNRIEAFKKDGRFDKKKFLEVLKRENVDPKDFERKERTALRIVKSSEIFKDLAVSFGEEDAWEEYKRENGMVRFRYSVFSPDDYREKVKVSEKEIEERYEKEKGTYVSEAVYRLKYVVIEDKGPIREDRAYMELIKSRDLHTFAKTYGLSVYDSGFLPESQLKQRLKEVKDFSWLTDLRVGDISLPVRVQNGYYIFQLVDYRQGQPLEKELVKKKLKERIILEKAKKMAKEKASQALSESDSKFQKVTDFVQRNSTSIPGIGQIPDEDRGLFQLDKKNPVYKKPVEISGKFYVFSFDSEKIPEREVWEKRKTEYVINAFTKKREEALKRLLTSLKGKEKIKIHWQEL